MRKINTSPKNASGTSGGDPTPDLTRKAITRPIGDTSLFFGAVRIEMHWLATCRQATSKKSR
jgi:hypothetical protein